MGKKMDNMLLLKALSDRMFSRVLPDIGPGISLKTEYLDDYQGWSQGKYKGNSGLNPSHTQVGPLSPTWLINDTSVERHSLHQTTRADYIILCF